MNKWAWNDLEIGQSASFTTCITDEMMQRFYDITGDCSPIHMDAAYAKDRGYIGRVVYGMLSASMFSTLAGVYLPGASCLLHSVDTAFIKPVYIGDTLTVSAAVKERNDMFRQITMKAQIINQHGEKVVRGVIKAGVAEG